MHACCMRQKPEEYLPSRTSNPCTSRCLQPWIVIKHCQDSQHTRPALPTITNSLERFSLRLRLLLLDENQSGPFRVGKDIPGTQAVAKNPKGQLMRASGGRFCKSSGLLATIQDRSLIIKHLIQKHRNFTDYPLTCVFRCNVGPDNSSPRRKLNLSITLLFLSEIP